MTEINLPKPERGLPDIVIKRLGYSSSDIELIRNKYTDTLDEFRYRAKTAPEMVIWESKTNKEFSFNDGYIFKPKFGSKYVTDLITFINLFDDKLVKATNLFKKNLNLYQGQDLTNKKLLCYAYGCGIGDTFFMQPILKSIKKLYPTCRITFALPKRHHSLIRSWDFIDNVIATPFQFHYFTSADYHLTFDGLIGKCREAERENIYKLLRRWTNIPINDIDLIPQQKINVELKEYWKNILEQHYMRNTPFMIVQLRADTIVRTPRDEFKIKLLKSLINKGIYIVIVDIPSKHQEIDNLIKQLDVQQGSILNFCKYSLNIEYASALLSLSTMITSVDTGIIHLAASVNKPIFGIYGPFIGKIRCETYPNCYWIDAHSECAPCFLHSYKPCKHNKNGYPICYDNINITELSNNIEILWKEVI